MIIYAFAFKDVSLSLEFSEAAVAEESRAPTWHKRTEETRPVKTSQKASRKKKKTSGKHAEDENLANTFSNLLFDDRGLTEAEKAEKRRKMQAYVKQYAEYAVAEMKKHHIPASITLAQGLLESDAGESRLAVQNNNHFGLKCFSKTCKRGHCTNYTDDSHKDFFRKFKTPEESFRAHSALLKGERYQFLFRYKANDYEAWAEGLQEAGYATDSRYAQKLIGLINELKLHQYDR